MGFRICLVGCGGMAVSYHGPAYALYAAANPGTELAACCDLDAEKGRQCKERVGFARVYTDMEEMLRQEKPDAVCLIVPVHATCALACRILAWGFPVLMEKPPGLTLDETDRIIAAADRSKTPNQVAFNRRFMPMLQRLRELLRSLDGPSRLQHIRYELTRSRRTDPDFATTAIHAIDAVRFLTGSDYRNIRFRYHECPEHGPTVANIFLDCGLASGATAHLSLCPISGVILERVATYAYDHTVFVSLPLTNAFDGPGLLQHVHCGQTVLTLTGTDITPSAREFELSGFYGENKSFFDDIRNGRRPADDVRSARQSVAVAQCIRERRGELTA